jgi:hypothetical protein
MKTIKIRKAELAVTGCSDLKETIMEVLALRKKLNIKEASFKFNNKTPLLATYESTPQSVYDQWCKDNNTTPEEGYMDITGPLKKGALLISRDETFTFVFSHYDPVGDLVSEYGRTYSSTVYDKVRREEK